MKFRAIVGFLAVLAGACDDPTAIVVEPLRVVSWSPNGYPCVDPGVTIRATFSADLDPATLTPSSLFLLDAGGEVDATIEYDTTVFTAQLRPTAQLAYDTQYTAVATAEIGSAEKGALPARSESPFRTIALHGCTPGVECFHPSECPVTGQICSSLGTCVNECVTDADCYRATCSSGSCVYAPVDDGPPGGDPGPGDDTGGGDGGTAGDGDAASGDTGLGD